MQQTATAEAPQQTVQKSAPKHLWKPGVSANPTGRPKGLQNKATRTIKEAIELACQPGQCHPQGLAGWLVERAQGGVQDRQIFATFVAKAIPAQLQASVSADIVVQLPWLQGRAVGVRTHPRTQPEALEAQVIDAPSVLAHDLRVDDPTSVSEPVEAGPIAAENPPADPHPPLERQAGGVVE
jgi:hypothetical protein